MLSTLSLTARNFMLRALTKKRGHDMALEKPIAEFPKWVEGQIVKDSAEEAKVKDGGKSSATPTMTKPKAPKRRDGRKL